MDLRKCKVGHFYDGDKFPECPHCKNNVSERVSKTSERKTVDEKKNETRALGSIEEKRQEREEKRQNQRRPIDEEIESNSLEIENKKEIDLPQRKTDLGPVVGWLVGIQGNEYGRSYELFATSNTIGVATSNIVSIKDSNLCNTSHCIICFDVNSLNFFIDYENSGGKIRVNNYRVSENVYINYMDVIEIGESAYTLIPICKDGFTWWNNSQSTNSSYTKTSETYNNSNFASQYENKYSQNEFVPKFRSIDDEIVYQPDNNYTEDIDEEVQQELTGILISSPWRCPDCNALNSMMFNKCRTCGRNK